MSNGDEWSHSCTFSRSEGPRFVVLGAKTGSNQATAGGTVNAAQRNVSASGPRRPAPPQGLFRHREGRGVAGGSGVARSGKTAWTRPQLISPALYPDFASPAWQRSTQRNLVRWIWPALLLLALVTASCASSRQVSSLGPRPHGSRGYVKDRHPAIWNSQHPRIVEFREHYRQTKTVEAALDQGRRFLPTILPAFERRGLPRELAYLPMLESRFENRADSGHARGLWQFTPQTAAHMGLRVSARVDERLNWRKSSEAAAEYLDALGERFGYDWALALAAYNGGPNYLDEEMRRQHRSDFFSLELRKETAEYVPRFIAMLQVAKEKQLVALK
jgi:hypothetical protein